MNLSRALFRSALPALCAAALLGALITPSLAKDLRAPMQDDLRAAMQDDLRAPMRIAGADCYAIGQQIAAQDGGTLAKATQASRGGQSVCVIVVLVPGKDGQRPRREEHVVPAS